MKHLFSIIICFGLSIGLYGQTVRIEGDLGSLAKTPTPRDTLDFSKMRVQYQVWMMKDTLHPEKITDDLLLLQIGSKISKFSNYYGMINDSILNQEILSGMDANEMLKSRRSRRQGDLNLMGEFLKNHPAEKITTVEWVPFDGTYYFEEDIPDFQWKLEKDEQEVLGYLCKKATCHFRGRTYEAWYAPEIPISDGPWKFSGLPGLILKVSDAKKQYCYEAIALFGVSWKDPIYKKKKIMKTSRKNFGKALKRYMDNPAAAIQNSDKIQGPPIDPSKVKAKPYNPIELE